MKTSQIRYQLEKYQRNRRTRYTCPNCGRAKEFTRYIDIETGQYIHPTVGKCNREDNCGYHLPPKAYFQDNGFPESDASVLIDVIVRQMSFLPKALINANFKSTSLYQFLCSRFNAEDVTWVMEKYRVGASDKWPNAVVFYQFDRYGRCRTGKVMAYNSQNGKRIKQPYSHIAWLHTEIADFNLKQCLFGEHLLAGNSDTVCIVESEKTAIIMAIQEPDYIWLATGGLCNLNKNAIKSLGLRKIILFPDAGCADKWTEKAQGTSAYIDRQLEIFSIGTDLADMVLRETVL